MPLIQYGQCTDVGLSRSNNEDSVLSIPGLGLWAVADGMGGHEAGEVASKIANQTLEQQVAQGAGLAHAILTSHQSILSAVDHGQGKFGMGSTLVALSCTGYYYKIGWVGDSRAYLLRQKQPLKQLSVDHSYVQGLYQQGLISKEDMATHPDRNIITQCLGSTEHDQIVVDTLQQPWQANDRLLLCSDGLNDYVEHSKIEAALRTHSNPQDAVKALIELALDAGGKDNISVIVVDAPIQLKPGLHGVVQRLFNFKRPK